MAVGMKQPAQQAAQPTGVGVIVVIVRVIVVIMSIVVIMYVIAVVIVIAVVVMRVISVIRSTMRMISLIVVGMPVAV
jgi:hypothetical protein